MKTIASIWIVQTFFKIKFVQSQVNFLSLIDYEYLLTAGCSAWLLAKMTIIFFSILQNNSVR